MDNHYFFFFLNFIINPIDLSLSSIYSQCSDYQNINYVLFWYDKLYFE